MRGQRQLTFFDDGPTLVDRDLEGLERRDLGQGAWLDVLPGWVRGSQPLCDGLLESMAWESHKMKMYDRVVDQPRLTARLDREAWAERWPALEAMAEALSERYGERFDSCLLNLYRDGNDAVAWHGDRHGRTQARAFVANVSLGYPRRFRIRPKGGGDSIGFELGRGGLLVMGGTCQRTFEHSVPRMAYAEPRISVTFRPASGPES